jgi:hypothetical protein
MTIQIMCGFSKGSLNSTHKSFHFWKPGYEEINDPGPNQGLIIEFNAIDSDMIQMLGCPIATSVILPSYGTHSQTRFRSRSKIETTGQDLYGR